MTSQSVTKGNIHIDAHKIWFSMLCLGWFPSEYIMKNSDHFLQLIKSVNLQNSDTLITFYVVSLFTNVPFDEGRSTISNRLQNDHTLAEWSMVQIKAIMDLLEVCLRTNYFQVEDRFFRQKDAWLWQALCPWFLVTSSCRILSNWLMTWHNTNRHSGFNIWMIHLWPGHMIYIGYTTT